MLESATPKTTYDLIRYNPHLLRDLERALEAQQLLQAPEEKLGQTRTQLLTVYLLADELDRGIVLAEEMLRRPGITPGQRVDVLEAYAWLLVRKGHPQRALDEVNRYLLAGGAPTTYDPAHLPLLLIR